MPAPTSKNLAKKKRATQAVAARVAGEPAREIASRLSVSRKTITRDLGSKHARILVMTLIQEKEQELRRIFNRSLEVIEEALEANVIEIFVDRDDGSRIASLSDYPDFKTRLEAIRRYRELVSLGLSLPADTGGDDEETYTWEQYQRFTQVLDKTA